MQEMKTVPASDYARLLNEHIAKTHPALGTPPVTVQVTGAALQERTHLHIPRATMPAAISAVFELRQHGIFCFPVLAPLDDHRLV